MSLERRTTKPKQKPYPKILTADYGRNGKLISEQITDIAWRQPSERRIEEDYAVNGQSVIVKTVYISDLETIQDLQTIGRNYEMWRLRVKDGMWFTHIAKKFGLSPSRVREIVGLQESKFRKYGPLINEAELRSLEKGETGNG